MTHHSDKQPGLLRSASNACITYNTNCKARSKTGKPDRETGTKLDKASVERHLRSDLKVEISTQVRITMLWGNAYDFQK